MFKINLKIMKFKLLFFGVITSLFIGCSGGPAACQCLDMYEYKGVNVKDFKMKDTRPCIKKYGKKIPDEYKGKQIFIDKMKEILREKCNR